MGNFNKRIERIEGDRGFLDFNPSEKSFIFSKRYTIA